MPAQRIWSLWIQPAGRPYLTQRGFEPMQAPAHRASAMRPLPDPRRRQPLGLSLGRDRDHVPCQPGPLHGADHEARRIELPQRRPWKAERGKAWWLWCQASPSEASESHQTFVEWSSAAKRRAP